MSTCLRFGLELFVTPWELTDPVENVLMDHRLVLFQHTSAHGLSTQFTSDLHTMVLVIALEFFQVSHTFIAFGTLLQKLLSMNFNQVGLHQKKAFDLYTAYFAAENVDFDAF